MSLLNGYKVITITHHNLNVDEIGFFMVKHRDNIDLKDKLAHIKNTAGIDEMIYLATCNRVSFVCYAEREFDADFLSMFFLLVNPELSRDHLRRIPKYADVFVGRLAVQHLFEVSSSMDSLVVGEREIFRQFRQSYHLAQECGHIGDNLRLLEKHTVVTAKSIYANTKIGEKPLSIVSLAMQEMFSKDLGDDPRILMVGAGETNTLVGKFLKKRAYASVSIYNRSLDNARELSEMLDAQAYHLSELQEHEAGFDVLIVCTGSTDPVITQKVYKKLLGKETTPKLVIDLAVPANVSHDVVHSHDFTYINIDKLRSRAEENLAFRKQEVTVARDIIVEKLKAFDKIFQHRQLEKSLSHIPQQINAIKQHAIENVYKKKLEPLDPETLSLIKEMMDYMEKKCVSIPIKAAKSMIE